jgi:DHA2 family multidrug resistance protein
MGTFISTLNGRLSTFGLADIRGAIGAGFDEGAWITTAQTSAQMFVTLAAIWMGAAYGPRRVLIGASIAFAIISLLTPYSPTLPLLLTMQFLGGLASGCFIPLTLSFILLNTPPKYWAFGIAIYALNLELSLNTPGGGSFGRTCRSRSSCRCACTGASPASRSRSGRRPTCSGCWRAAPGSR